MNLTFRKAEKTTDFDAIWAMWWEITLQKVFYAYDEDYKRNYIQKNWFESPNHCVVAENERNQIVGAYIIKPNQPGYGNHIANAAYMVQTSNRGKGIGKLLGNHSLKEAVKLGYEAMQFNLVVSTNTSAIKAWQSIGFDIIGIVPEGFRHYKLGKVDAYIMYKKLL